MNILNKNPLLMTDDELDGYARHLVGTVQTQHAIIKYSEAMAEVLAEAAVASHKATGDYPLDALDKWVRVIRNKARDIIQKPKEQRKLDAPVIEHDR